MYRIVNYKDLSEPVFEMEIEAPQIAKKAQPGQFLIVRIDENGERIPLTIADQDLEKGTVTIVVQRLGRTTEQLGKMRAGDTLIDVVGPLGKPSEIENYGTVVIVGGGVGIAPIHPIAKALKEAGNHVVTIIGARNTDLLFWREQLKEASHELYIATDDGSEGEKGFVTGILARICAEQDVKRVWAVGPMVMMRNAVEVTKPMGIKTFVSMNPIMIDGTGMCGCCRVQVGTETKFACVDGPEFDGAEVDFDLAMKRVVYLRDVESEGRLFYHDRCTCGHHKVEGGETDGQ